MADARPVPRGLRVVNALLLLLFLVGAGLYARAWVGMEGLTTYEPTPADPAFAAMARFHQLWGLSVTAVWIVAGAVLGSVAVAIVHRRRPGAAAAGEAEA